MDARQLETFVTVAEELSFTKAAKRLHAVQSTVSASIRALEAELGTQLFTRSTRSVVLTAAGIAVLPEARDALDAVDRVKTAAADSRRGLRGRIRFGVFASLALVDLPTLLATFRERYPLVELEITTSPTGSMGLTDDLRAGRVDVALIGLPDRDLTGLSPIPLASSDFVALVPSGHRLALAHDVQLADLARERFVDTPRGFGNRVVVDRAFASLGLERTVATEVADLASVPTFVAAGLGIALVPVLTLNPVVGALPVTLAGPPLEFLLTIATAARARPAPAVSALISLVTEQYPHG